MTELRKDPAAGWLSATGRAVVTVKSWLPWVGYFLLIAFVRSVAHYVMENVVGVNISIMGLSIPNIIAGSLGATLLFPVRYLAIFTRASATARHAKEDAGDVAKQVDDLDALHAEPEGRVVSLVGWVRGHAYLLHRAGDHQAVGVTIHCRGQHLLETLHNFDLIDETNGTALVVAEGARLLGKPNVQLSRASREDAALVHSLDLPAGVVPTYWNAFVVRDGDPVMVIGVKKTVHDMTELQHGRPAARTALGSGPNQPLLLVPLEAERREV